MITLACLTCRLALMISGDHAEMDYLVGMKSEWYPDRYPCPQSGCKGTMVLTDTVASTELENLRIHHLNPQETFQTLQGMGLPEERKCGEDMVRLALVGGTITAAELRGLSGSNRTVVHSLTFSNGCRLYLGSSPFGAIAYRISFPRSHVQELDQDHLEPQKQGDGGG